MQQFGGAVYPEARHMLAAGTKNRRAGWLLSHAELCAIVKQLVGAPIIMDHAVTLDVCKDSRPPHQAIETIGMEEFARSRDPNALLKCPIGRVVSAFIDSRGAARITFTLCRGFAAVVKRGLYAWLSLSHFYGDTAPLEVSLTPTPGRPGCAIDAMVNDADEYKVIVSNQIKATMDTKTEVTQTPLEAAIAGLPENERELVKLRFCELQQATNDATAARDKAESARAALATTEATEQDYKALDHVLGQLVSRIDHERYNISPAMYNYASRNDPEKLKVRNLEAMLCACNRALSEVSAATPEQSTNTKRKRTDEPETAHNRLSNSSSESLLAQALEEKFSGGRNTTVW